MPTARRCLYALTFLLAGFSTVRADGLRVGAAAVPLEASDDLVIGGGILPGHATGQEGELRASAVVIEGPDGNKVALIACDVLMIARDILDPAAERISQQTQIPFENILINATHTHHAPTTVTIHGYEREEAFTRQVAEKIVQAAVAANNKLQPAVLDFRLGEESSVGKNSRLLLEDGTIYWIGSYEDAVRPTGPFDPELPVLVFRKPDGPIIATLFNHSTHTIGTVQGAVRSPSFYGLAAQDLEKKLGGVFIFFEGASGSTHNLGVKTDEARHRIESAVSDAIDRAEPMPVDHVLSRKSEITLHVRHFDESADEAAVSAYCNKRSPAEFAPKTIEVFRAMRQKLADHQGEARKTWVQAVLIGDIAFVGVPGEYFTVLGEEIKRRSPYRYTYVFELANDYVGYVPDKAGYDLGGYQVWTGLHSFLERGSGEMIVESAVELLERLHTETSPAKLK